MAENVKFRVNNKVEIAWNDEYYKSNIEDVTDTYIGISIPTKSGKYLPLSKGDQIEVLYHHGKDIYKFNSIIIGRKIQRIAIFMMAMPKEVFMVQRRKFVRVPIVCSLDFTRVNTESGSKDTKAIISNNSLFKAIMVDLSGGGMKIKTNTEIKIGDIIVSYIPIAGEDLIVKGKVVRLVIDEDKRYVCGVDFFDLDNKQREKLIKYIFNIMRDQMKKGLKGD